jgi:hypothetical protein
MTNEVEELTLPAASVAVNRKVVVVPLVSGTRIAQVPPTAVVVVPVTEPPTILTVEPASAVPVTTTELAIVV